eukprot:3957710-Pyramimonas_sp.AAC.1
MLSGGGDATPGYAPVGCECEGGGSELSSPSPESSNVCSNSSPSVSYIAFVPSCFFPPAPRPPYSLPPAACLCAARSFRNETRHVPALSAQRSSDVTLVNMYSSSGEDV